MMMICYQSNRCALYTLYALSKLKHRACPLLNIYFVFSAFLTIYFFVYIACASAWCVSLIFFRKGFSTGNICCPDAIHSFGHHNSQNVRFLPVFPVQRFSSVISMEPLSPHKHAKMGSMAPISFDSNHYHKGRWGRCTQNSLANWLFLNPNQMWMFIVTKGCTNATVLYLSVCTHIKPWIWKKLLVIFNSVVCRRSPCAYVWYITPVSYLRPITLQSMLWHGSKCSRFWIGTHLPHKIQIQ